MVNQTSPFSMLVEQRLAALGTNAFAAEQAAGLPQDAIRNVIRSEKKDGPSISRAKEICDAIGLEFYIGPRRELSGFAEPSDQADLHKVDALRGGFLPIPWHDSARKRGSAPVALHSGWLASEGFVPDHLRAVAPENPQSLIADPKNTVAILDISAARKGASGLWCYRHDGALTLGRAAFSDGAFALFPPYNGEGPVYIFNRQDEKCPEILGRVVWLGFIPR